MMALRVSLQIDGDARGAEEAAAAASRAIGDLGKTGETAAKGLEGAFDAASGKAAGLAGATKAAGAANDNTTASALGLAAQLDQVAQKALGSETALTKVSAGAINIAKGISGLSASAGTIGLLTGAIGLAATVATTFYSLVNSGAAESSKRLDENARVIGAVRDAYSGANKTAGEFLTTSRDILLLQAQQNREGLQGDLTRQAKPLTRAITPFPSQAIAGEFSVLDQNVSDATAKLSPFQGAVDNLLASIQRGAPDVEAYRRSIAAIGVAAGVASPEIARQAASLLKESEEAGTTAIALAKAEAAIAKLNGTQTARQDALIGTASAVRDTTNEFDRLLKSLSRQTAAQEAEAQSVGKSAEEQARLRAQYVLTEAAQQAGIAVSGKYAEKLQAISDRAGEAAKALALANVKDQINFGAATSLLSPDDVAIAQQLRGIYPDVAEALGSVEASGLRANAALSAFSSSASGSVVTAIADITDGTKSLSQGAADMSKAVIRSLEEMLIKAAIVAPIFRALQGALTGFGGLGGLGSLFGGGDISGGSSAAPLAGLTADDYGAGFATGGYTGAGGRRQPAGIVHKGEVVWSQDDVSRAGGVHIVESMRRGLSGYDLGGPVGIPPISVTGSRVATGDAPAMKIEIVKNGSPIQVVEAQDVPDGRGGRSLRLQLDDAIASAVQTSGSQTRKAFGNTYGAKPSPTRRG